MHRHSYRTAGIGAYTGNAIASIACKERDAVVDANVVRVLARLRRLAGDPKLAVKEHAALADALLDPERPGDFNQVLTQLLIGSRRAPLQHEHCSNRRRMTCSCMMFTPPHKFPAGQCAEPVEKKKLQMLVWCSPLVKLALLCAGSDGAGSKGVHSAPATRLPEVPDQAAVPSAR